METKSITLLKKQERDVLILAAKHSRGKHFTNSEIALQLGISVSKVKTLIHSACVKLRAHGRNEAIHFAIKRGYIRVDDIYSLDDLALLLSSLGPNMLRRIAYFLRHGLGFGHILEYDKAVPYTNIKLDAKLTPTERDILILAASGLKNKEISDKRCIALGSVGILLWRAFIKLGAYKRADAAVLALKQGEIGIEEILSVNELMEFLCPLGPEIIEEIAQLMEKKVGKSLSQLAVSPGSPVTLHAR